MIRLDWVLYIAIPVALNLGLLFLMGLYYYIRAVSARSRSPATRIYKCETCSHVYIGMRDVPLARCPRCNGLNEAVKR